MTRAKRLFFGALLLVAAALASAQTMVTVFGPTQVSIPKNTFTTTARAVPVNVTAVELIFSRENWPAGGIDIDLQISFDNQATWTSPGPTHIDPFVPDVKHTDVLKFPANIGRGWNQDISQATHVRAQTTNPSGSAFLSTMKINTQVVE
jgi:hypothetical protein